MKRTWEQIDEIVIKAILYLQKFGCPTTTQRIHPFIGTGLANTHLGNTEQLLRRMRKHGLLEQRDNLEWVVTLIGMETYKEIIKERTIERFKGRREHIPLPEHRDEAPG